MNGSMVAAIILILNEMDCHTQSNLVAMHRARAMLLNHSATEPLLIREERLYLFRSMFHLKSSSSYAHAIGDL